MTIVGWFHVFDVPEETLHEPLYECFHERYCIHIFNWPVVTLLSWLYSPIIPYYCSILLALLSAPNLYYCSTAYSNSQRYCSIKLELVILYHEHVSNAAGHMH